MATYDLRCRSCGHEFEIFVLGFLKDEAKVCPQCGSREVERRFTAFEGVVSFGSSEGRSYSGGGGKSCASSCSTHSCSTCGRR